MTTDFNVNEIVLACDVRGKSATTTHKNRASHGLVYILNKSQYVFDNGTTIDVVPNDILYLPKGSSYSVKLLESGLCYAINFNCSEKIEFAPFAYKPKNQIVLENFKKAKRVWSEKLTGYQMKCKAELYNVIYYIQQEYSAKYQSKDKLQIIAPAIEFIHANYTTELICIEKLAKLCRITPEYFRKIFKFFYGTSPLNYINNLKIEHAKELLASGLYSVTETALSSGFVDPSHFSRVFKKHTGRPPYKY